VSALALADAIEAATGVPSAPLFWAATDDADFAEASWTAVARPGGAETLRMSRVAPDGTPMAEVPLGTVAPLLARLEQAAGSVAYSPALDAVRAAYNDGKATVGSAYVRLLRTILEPLGIGVLDASHPAVRSAAAPHLRRALSRADAVESALLNRQQALEARGFTPQVGLVEGLSLVFVHEGGERRRVRTSEAALIGRVANRTDLSPNVLLRPVIERAILPTVAYVGGPSEVAYFAQVNAVAQALDLSAPLVVPRWSCTIVEPHVARILDRYGLAPDDLRDPHAAETRLARAALPSTVVDALAGLRASIELATAQLLDTADAADPLLPAAVVDGTHRQLMHRVDRLQRRYVAAVKRREVALTTDVATARGALYPDGKRQERALNFVPILARHGTRLIERMIERAGEQMSAAAGLERAPGPVSLAARP
jgi:bacillithiol biosynthesis cysteine-adding enzyme BshC